MYDLVQLAPRTYYIDAPVRIGIYRIDDTRVALIDSGNSPDAAKRILRVLDAQGFSLSLVIDTHTHADHIGGNALLQQRTGCAVYALDGGTVYARHPLLNPTTIFGGYPAKAMRNKFLLPQPADVRPLTADVLPQGLTFMPLYGHAYDMIGVRTDDDVWFVSDSVMSVATMEKYHIAFLYDVAGYLDMLTQLGALEGKLFVPSHADPVSDLSELIAVNRDKVYEIVDILLRICKEKIRFEDILHNVFAHYGLSMDMNQCALVGFTVRSYLSYLCDRGDMRMWIENNYLWWQTEEPS